MYTIIMNDDKSLSTTVRETLYQREVLANKIQFLFPQEYEEFDISSCEAVFEFVLEDGTPDFEVMQKDEELYNDKYIRYILPVNSKINWNAGIITGHFSFIKIGEDIEYLLHTGDTKIEIRPIRDYSLFMTESDGRLVRLDKAVVEKVSDNAAEEDPEEDPENGNGMDEP